jgi:hypothetical protein
VDRLRDPRARLQLAHARVALAEALHPLPEWKERELEERAYHARLKAEYRARERLQRGDR